MRGRHILIALGAVLGLLIAVLAGGYLWLDSRSGHAFVVRQIANFQAENGLTVRIGRIEGSLYDRAVLRDVRILDTQGSFALIPEARLDWHPFAYLRGAVRIDRLVAPEARLNRLPQLRAVPDRGEPLLPDIDIHIGELRIDRVRIAPAVTGRAQTGSLRAKVDIADRRAVIDAAAATSEGDRLALRLDAVPDDNRFDVKARLAAPATGLFAAMTGQGMAMTMTLDGRGDWQRWDGALAARTGDTPLADLALSARNGLFAVKGDVAAQPLLGDTAIGRGLAGTTAVDMTAALDKRIARLSGTVRSEAATIALDGVADLGESRFDDLAVDFTVPRAERFAPNVHAAGLTGRLLLNEGFVAPTVSYRITAARLAFDQTALEGFSASGEARGRNGEWSIPVTARARRISGVNQVAGGLLTNVALNGNLAMANGRILSDNLRIRSDRINATALLVGDIGAGVYTGALNGRVDDFRLESVGLFNVEADVDLETRTQQGFALVGTVKARSTRLFSDGVRNFLGGQMTVNSGIRYGTDGVLRITRTTLIAPQFRLNTGSGTYVASSGRVVFNGSGLSSQYGRIALAITGTATRPEVRIRAANPGLGVGLADIDARVTRSAQGFAVTFTGASDYGPVGGALDIVTGTGPLTIDVRRGDFAGIGFAGRIRQTAAGPFAGELRGSGSGFDGTVLLSSQGRFQRAVIDATANNAMLSGMRTLSIGRGIIRADVTLFNQPQVVADVQLENAVSGTLSIAAARARINYQGGSGTARLLAEGRSAVPFRVAVNAALTPTLWRIAARGRASGVDFATDGPLRIVPERGGYAIRLSRITIGDGNVRLAGRYGDGIELQSRLDNVSLAALAPVMPGLGLGGRVSGSVDWSQPSLAAFPRADARLEIARFTRISLGAASQPVDISLVGRLLPDGGNARAVIRRRGAAVGRVQIDLKPLAPGTGPWTERLLAAPLGGGIRYNGPADTLFSLAALADQSLSGNIGVAADFTGRVQQPALTGVVRANDLIYENDVYGTRLTAMRVRGTFTNDQLDVTELTARAGDGTISGRGFVNLSSAKGFPLQLDLNLDRARLARSDLISAAATGALRVSNTPGGDALVSGTLALPETRFRIVRQGSARVTTLTGVRRKAPAGRPRVTGDADAISSLPGDWKLDIRLTAADELYVRGMGLESEWGARLHVTGTSGAPRMAGEMELVRGTLGFAGRSFELESGRISFTGGVITDPALRVTAASEVDGTTVRVNVAGTGTNPEITFSSTPALPQDEIMARILFGNSIGELSAVQAVQLAASLNSLRGGTGGFSPMSVLQSATGIDRLRILGADEQTGRGTAVALGQYITNDVYVEIVTDARGYTASQIEISLTPALSLLSQISSFGTSNVNVRYRKDY